MAEVILMPKLSDTMVEGVVADWLVNVGDTVSAGDVLAEIETDKATMEFESFFDGELLYIGVEKGAMAPVNDVLAIIGKKGDDVEALIKEAKAGLTSGSEAKEEVKEELAAPSPAPAQASAPVASAPAASAPVAKPTGGRVFASPLARKLAEEKGYDIASIPGTGEGGRIVKKDVESYTPSASGASLGASTSYTDTPISQMRKTIARRLSESKFTAPHFYLTVSIDMDNAIAARKQVNATGKVKISFNDMVVKAVATALKSHPGVNSAWLNDVIRTYDYVNIGVAVAVEDGLLVPVVRNADLKGLSQIGAEVREYAQKAKDKKLQPSDWEGNTFTISNLGMFGIEEFTAIVNPPDACILAVGGISQVPVVKDGQVVPGNVMKVTLSCDHRVVDGATGAAFLNDVKANLENPVLMLV
jgi:pyruvate dehydrogenase E2 component (dihydrolipoamide acetyltransferase)